MPGKMLHQAAVVEKLHLDAIQSTKFHSSHKIPTQLRPYAICGYRQIQSKVVEYSLPSIAEEDCIQGILGEKLSTQ